VRGGPTNRTLWRGIAALVCAAVLGGAVAAEEGKRPERFEIEGVPFVKQQRDWCGPAALASVLQYRGERITQKEIAEAIYLPGRGTLNVDLLLFARRRGYAAAMENGTAERLKETIAAGSPVICQVERRRGSRRLTHFVVVYGYDDAKQAYRLHQGSRGAVWVGQEAFEKAWARGARWMLIVGPKPEQDDEDA
jgi:ABC-type bacteriocin/lantibiotic exporter with double-glycine peptidase domain